LSNAGSYPFVITNPAGSVASPPAILQVVPFGAPSIQINNQFAFGSVSPIGSAQLTICGGFTNGLIFYTLDGTTPTTSSPLYAGPVTLTHSATVQVMGLSADFTQTAYAPPVTVQIIPVYDLQTWVVGSGTISIGPTNGPYASNTVVVLTANAGVNWAFDHWTGDVSGSQNPLSLTMNGPRNVQAVFVQNAYPLTASTTGGGSVTVNGQVISPATLYPTGSVVTLRATASNGWSFLGWQGDASGTSNPLSLTLSQTNNVQGIFGTVVGTNTAGGGGIVLSQPNPIPYGTVLTASAVPNSGEYFVAWSGAAGGTKAPTTISVTDANPTVGALFTTLPGGKYSLAVVLMGNGSVAISPQRSYYSPGDSVTLSASTTVAGTHFYGWTGDASGTNNPLVVVVSSNRIVQANFVGLPTVTISPGNLMVFAGSNAVFNANAAGLPPLGYQWQFDGTNIAGATTSSLTLTNVQPSQAGNYLVIVSNSVGSVTSAVAVLTVDVPPGAPAIASQPGSLAMRSGESANFTVVATGNSPLLYQWYRGVSGDTNSPVGVNRPDYITGALTNNTSYWVSVGNSQGTVASDTAWVTVVPAQTPKLSFQILAGYPVITLDGKVGTNYVLQYKNSLTDSSWTPLLNFNLSANPFTFFDTTATGVPRRFYGAFAH
jgi:hypothetical protein